MISIQYGSHQDLFSDRTTGIVSGLAINLLDGTSESAMREQAGPVKI